MDLETYPVPLGTVLDGRYLLHSMLGHGGMGYVYEGEDLRLGRRVAIKIVREGDDDRCTGERLFREAKAAARSEHPAVVTAYGYGSDPDQAIDYFVMERLHGETVSERLARVGPLSLPLVLRIGTECADALIAVHAAGVIHRDLKPSNIFLASRGRRVDDIKLLDFGLAKQISLQTLTLTGNVYGTPMYMAPEQLSDSKRVDARCDIYALGAVLYECLTAARPFAAPNPFRIALEVMHGAPPDPRARRLDVPEPLAQIVMRCMMRERNDRFPDASAMYTALGTVSGAEKS